MSSILGSFDPSQIQEDAYLSGFANSYELGQIVPEKDAKKVVNRKDRSIRKGEFILAKIPSSKNYVYAVFEGDLEAGDIFYDTGDGVLVETDVGSIFKIRDHRAIDSNKWKSQDLAEQVNRKTPSRVTWANKKKIRILTENHPLESIRDTKMRVDKSTYRYLLKNHAFCKDPLKFLKIKIIDEAVKDHVFNDFLAMKALKIRVLHDDQLLEEFDKAIEALETIQETLDHESNPKAKYPTLEQYQTAAIVLKLFMHEVSRRGLEDSASN